MNNTNNNNIIQLSKYIVTSYEIINNLEESININNKLDTKIYYKQLLTAFHNISDILSTNQYFLDEIMILTDSVYKLSKINSKKQRICIYKNGLDDIVTSIRNNTKINLNQDGGAAFDEIANKFSSKLNLLLKLSDKTNNLIDYIIGEINDTSNIESMVNIRVKIEWLVEQFNTNDSDLKDAKNLQKVLEGLLTDVDNNINKTNESQFKLEKVLSDVKTFRTDTNTILGKANMSDTLEKAANNFSSIHNLDQNGGFISNQIGGYFISNEVRDNAADFKTIDNWLSFKNISNWNDSDRLLFTNIRIIYYSILETCDILVKKLNNIYERHPNMNPFDEFILIIKSIQFLLGIYNFNVSEIFLAEITDISYENIEIANENIKKPNIFNPNIFLYNIIINQIVSSNTVKLSEDLQTIKNINNNISELLYILPYIFNLMLSISDKDFLIDIEKNNLILQSYYIKKLVYHTSFIFSISKYNDFKNGILHTNYKRNFEDPLDIFKSVQNNIDPDFLEKILDDEKHYKNYKLGMFKSNSYSNPHARFYGLKLEKSKISYNSTSTTYDNKCFMRLCSLRNALYGKDALNIKFRNLIKILNDHSHVLKYKIHEVLITNLNIINKKKNDTRARKNITDFFKIINDELQQIYIVMVINIKAKLNQFIDNVLSDNESSRKVKEKILTKYNKEDDEVNDYEQYLTIHKAYIYIDFIININNIEDQNKELNKFMNYITSIITHCTKLEYCIDFINKLNDCINLFIDKINSRNRTDLSGGAITPETINSINEMKTEINTKNGKYINSNDAKFKAKYKKELDASITKYNELFVKLNNDIKKDTEKNNKQTPLLNLKAFCVSERNRISLNNMVLDLKKDIIATIKADLTILSAKTHICNLITINNFIDMYDEIKMKNVQLVMTTNSMIVFATNAIKVYVKIRDERGYKQTPITYTDTCLTINDQTYGNYEKIYGQDKTINDLYNGDSANNKSINPITKGIKDTITDTKLTFLSVDGFSGSGKTTALLGKKGGDSDNSIGIISRIITDICDRLNIPMGGTELKISYMIGEVYGIKENLSITNNKMTECLYLWEMTTNNELIDHQILSNFNDKDYNTTRNKKTMLDELNKILNVICDKLLNIHIVYDLITDKSSINGPPGDVTYFKNKIRELNKLKVDIVAINYQEVLSQIELYKNQVAEVAALLNVNNVKLTSFNSILDEIQTEFQNTSIDVLDSLYTLNKFDIEHNFNNFIDANLLQLLQNARRTYKEELVEVTSMTETNRKTIAKLNIELIKYSKDAGSAANTTNTGVYHIINTSQRHPTRIKPEMMDKFPRLNKNYSTTDAQTKTSVAQLAKKSPSRTFKGGAPSGKAQLRVAPLGKAQLRVAPSSVAPLGKAQSRVAPSSVAPLGKAQSRVAQSHEDPSSRAPAIKDTRDNIMNSLESNRHPTILADINLYSNAFEIIRYEIQQEIDKINPITENELSTDYNTLIYDIIKDIYDKYLNSLNKSGNVLITEYQNSKNIEKQQKYLKLIEDLKKICIDNEIVYDDETMNNFVNLIKHYNDSIRSIESININQKYLTFLDDNLNIIYIYNDIYIYLYYIYHCIIKLRNTTLPTDEYNYAVNNYEHIQANLSTVNTNIYLLDEEDISNNILFNDDNNNLDNVKNILNTLLLQINNNNEEYRFLITEDNYNNQTYNNYINYDAVKTIITDYPMLENALKLKIIDKTDIEITNELLVELSYNKKITITNGDKNQYLLNAGLFNTGDYKKQDIEDIKKFVTMSDFEPLDVNDNTDYKHLFSSKNYSENDDEAKEGTELLNYLTGSEVKGIKTNFYINKSKNILTKQDIKEFGETISKDINTLTDKIQVIRRANNRVRCTKYNPDSSRSHMFFIIKVNIDGRDKYYVFMDKAGNEIPFEIATNEFIKLADISEEKNKIFMEFKLENNIFTPYTNNIEEINGRINKLYFKKDCLFVKWIKEEEQNKIIKFALSDTESIIIRYEVSKIDTKNNLRTLATEKDETKDETKNDTKSETNPKQLSQYESNPYINYIVLKITIQLNFDTSYELEDKIIIYHNNLDEIIYTMVDLFSLIDLQITNSITKKYFKESLETHIAIITVKDNMKQLILYTNNNEEDITISNIKDSISYMQIQIINKKRDENYTLENITAKYLNINITNYTAVINILEYLISDDFCLEYKIDQLFVNRVKMILYKIKYIHKKVKENDDLSDDIIDKIAGMMTLIIEDSSEDTTEDTIEDLSREQTEIYVLFNKIKSTGKKTNPHSTSFHKGLIKENYVKDLYNNIIKFLNDNVTFNSIEYYQKLLLSIKTINKYLHEIVTMSDVYYRYIKIINYNKENTKGKKKFIADLHNKFFNFEIKVKNNFKKKIKQDDENKIKKLKKNTFLNKSVNALIEMIKVINFNEQVERNNGEEDGEAEVVEVVEEVKEQSEDDYFGDDFEIDEGDEGGEVDDEVEENGEDGEAADQASPAGTGAADIEEDDDGGEVGEGEEDGEAADAGEDDEEVEEQLGGGNFDFNNILLYNSSINKNEPTTDNLKIDYIKLLASYFIQRSYFSKIKLDSTLNCNEPSILKGLDEITKNIMFLFDENHFFYKLLVEQTTTINLDEEYIKYTINPDNPFPDTKDELVSRSYTTFISKVSDPDYENSSKLLNMIYNMFEQIPLISDNLSSFDNSNKKIALNFNTEKKEINILIKTSFNSTLPEEIRKQYKETIENFIKRLYIISKLSKELLFLDIFKNMQKHVMSTFNKFIYKLEYIRIFNEILKKDFDSITYLIEFDNIFNVGKLIRSPDHKKYLNIWLKHGNALWRETADFLIPYYLSAVRQGMWINHSLCMMIRTLMYSIDDTYINNDLFDLKKDEIHTESNDSETEIILKKNIKFLQFDKTKSDTLVENIIKNIDTLENRYLIPYDIRNSIWIKLLLSLQHLGATSAILKSNIPIEHTVNDSIITCNSTDLGQLTSLLNEYNDITDGYEGLDRSDSSYSSDSSDSLHILKEKDYDIYNILTSDNYACSNIKGEFENLLIDLNHKINSPVNNSTIKLSKIFTLFLAITTRLDKAKGVEKTAQIAEIYSLLTNSKCKQENSQDLIGGNLYSKHKYILSKNYLS